MKTMEIQITEQFNEVYNLSIDIDVIINGQKFNIYGHINLDTYKAELYIVDMETHTLMTKDMREVELSEWCLRHGHDYEELKDYIINNIELPKNDSHDHESNSLSPDRPYIRYKTSVLKQMLMSGNVPSEILIEKELNLREYEVKRKDIANPNTRN
jgi:translation elongation factor EF-4